MSSSGSSAVFFLGNRAHYEALEQPSNYDFSNGNASSEKIYQNQSADELWTSEHESNGGLDGNLNDGLGWSNNENDTVLFEKTAGVGCVKRRGKRSSSEALLCDDIGSVSPAVNFSDDKCEQKQKTSRRMSLLSYLTSLARRKSRLESSQVEYLHRLEAVLTTCTYRESCRCLDCQGRYFECGEESDGYSSDEDYRSYSTNIGSLILPQLDDDNDEVFLDTLLDDNDNTSTDLLLEDEASPEETAVPEAVDDDETETDKQLQMEVAASTSAMFNVLLYHPFACSIQ